MILFSTEGGGVHFCKGALKELETLDTTKFSVFSIDGRCVENEKTFMILIKNHMNFPNYFGGNWDALHDCLTDLDTWLDVKQGVILIVKNGEVLFKQHPLIGGMLIECWADAADFWRKREVPFHLVFTEMEESN